MAAEKAKICELRASQIEAEGGAGRWAVLHRLEPPAELAAAKCDDPDAEDAEHDRHEDQVGSVAAERKTPDVEPADRRVTVLEGVDVGEDGLLQEEGERHRGEGQVEALQPQRGQRDRARRLRP